MTEQPINIEKLVEQFQQYSPENKDIDEVRELIIRLNGNEADIHREIGRWWEEIAYGTSPFGSPIQSPLQSPIQSPRASGANPGFPKTNGHSELASPVEKRSKKQDQFISGLNSPRSPKVMEIPIEQSISSDMPTPQREGRMRFTYHSQNNTNNNNNNPEINNNHIRDKKPSHRREKIIESKKLENTENSDGVMENEEDNKPTIPAPIMMQKNQFFDEDKQNGNQAHAFLNKVDRKNKYQSNDLNSRDVPLREVPSREFPSREFPSREMVSKDSSRNQSRDRESQNNELRSRERHSRDAVSIDQASFTDERARSRPGRKERKSSKRKHERKSQKHRSDSNNRARSASRPGFRISSQVRLLAEHCFTLSDDAIASLVKYKIPQAQSDAKDKIQKRDELIKHLQEALYVLSQEKQRFQTACADIEMCLHEENQELRQHLTMISNENADPYEMQQVREEIVTYKTKLKTKEEEAAKLLEARAERERRISELSNEIMRTQFDKKEDNEVKVRYEEDINKLKHELSALREEINKQNAELTSILSTFSEVQQESQLREGSLQFSHQDVDEKITRLEEEKAELQEQLNFQSADAAFLFSELATLKENLQNTKQQLITKKQLAEQSRFHAQQLREGLIIERELRARAELKEDEERRERIVACAQLLAIEAAHTDDFERLANEGWGDITEWEEKIKAVEVEKETQIELHGNLKGQLAELGGEISGLKSQLERALDKTEQIQQVGKLNETIQQLTAKLKNVEEQKKEDRENYNDRIELLEKVSKEKDHKIDEAETDRKRLHNVIQELRGNVKVFARVRPYLPGEGDENEVDADGNPLHSCATSLSTIEVKPDGTSITIRKKDELTEEVVEELSFTYDKAFAPSVGQEHIFKEISEFFQFAIDGYCVCLFCYGETASGKTHTIQGSGNGPMRGILSRAIEQFAACRADLQLQGWEYRLQFSFLEVYNEQMKDLMIDDTTELLIGEDNKNVLGVRFDKKGRPIVDGLTKIELDPEDQDMIDSIMSTAARHRASSKTDSNHHPSASSSIFTLYLTGYNRKQGFAVEGQFNLCDLSGSENIFESETPQEQPPQDVHLQKSLHTLSEVFVAIADRRSQLPVKNSILTQFLSHILNGDGKILMIINICPVQLNYIQSLATLKFGVIVNQCELGKAVKNVKEVSEDDDGNLIEVTGSRQGNNTTNGKKVASSVKPGPSSVAPSSVAPTPATPAAKSRIASKAPPRKK